MNKKEKEQLEINSLLKECIDEQLRIGLKPAENIEIYLGKDPVTNEKCNKTAYGFSFVSEGRNVIIIQKNFYKNMPISQIKRLIHHELIHLNLNKKDEAIEHIKDWKKFTELSNKIKTAYDINPLLGYTVDCFINKKSIPTYNCLSFCPRCGGGVYFVLDEGKEYDFNGTCPNCGEKLVYEKRTSTKN